VEWGGQVGRPLEGWSLVKEGKTSREKKISALREWCRFRGLHLYYLFNIQKRGIKSFLEGGGRRHLSPQPEYSCLKMRKKVNTSQKNLYIDTIKEKKGKKTEEEGGETAPMQSGALSDEGGKEHEFPV